MAFRKKMTMYILDIQIQINWLISLVKIFSRAIFVDVLIETGRTFSLDAKSSHDIILKNDKKNIINGGNMKETKKDRSLTEKVRIFALGGLG